MSVIKIIKPVLSILTFSLLVLPGTVLAEFGLNMTRGSTTISQEVYDLHMLTFWLVTIIGVIVFGLMIWSIIYHRKSRGAKASNFHHSAGWEALWTIIPIFILISFGRLCLISFNWSFTNLETSKMLPK